MYQGVKSEHGEDRSFDESSYAYTDRADWMAGVMFNDNGKKHPWLSDAGMGINFQRSESGGSRVVLLF